MLVLQSRIIASIGTGERNYHLFYMLAYLPDDEQEEIKYAGPEAYEYCRKAGCISVEGIDDQAEFKEMTNAWHSFNMLEPEIMAIYRVVSGILYLGNVVFEEGADGKSAIQNDEVLDPIGELFQAEPEILETTLTMRNMTTGGSIVVIPLEVEKAQEAQEGLAKATYSRLFDWVVQRLNDTVKAPSKFKNGKESVGYETTIGVLDIFGFEILELNSFEQLCINLANEKLQAHFNGFVFEAELKLYKKEGLDVSDITFADNQPCLDMLEKKPKGLLPMIDEECVVPRGSDDSLLGKLMDTHRKNPFWGKPPKGSRTCFVVNHFAGGVAYDITDFLEKNRDQLQTDLQAFMAESEDGLIQTMFPPPKPTRGRAPTLGGQFKVSLQELYDKLMSTAPFFIKCVKSNQVKQGGIFDSKYTLTQITYLGLLEVVNIRKQGYPVRRAPDVFFARYYSLGESRGVKYPKSLNLKSKGSVAFKQGLKDLLDTCGLDGQWQIGKNYVFMKDTMNTHMETQRGLLIEKTLQIIQQFFKKGLSARVWKEAKEGFLLMQAVARGVQGRSKFDAYKVVVQVSTDMEAAMADRDKDAIRKLLKKADRLEDFDSELQAQAMKLYQHIDQEDSITEGLSKALQSESEAALSTALADAAHMHKEDMQKKTQTMVETAQALLDKLTQDRLAGQDKKQQIASAKKEIEAALRSDEEREEKHVALMVAVQHADAVGHDDDRVQEARDQMKQLSIDIEVEKLLQKAMEQRSKSMLVDAIEKADDAGGRAWSLGEARMTLEEVEEEEEAEKQLKLAMKSGNELKIEAAAAAAQAAGVNAENSDVLKDAEENRTKREKAKMNTKKGQREYLASMQGLSYMERMQELSVDFSDLKNYPGLRSSQLSLNYTKIPIKRPLCKYEEDGVNSNRYELESKALSIFQNVLGYMGDRKMQFPEMLASEILNEGLENPELADEIYIQIIKQCSRNTTRSLRKGFQLLNFVCRTFAPTQDLLPYVDVFLFNGCVGDKFSDDDRDAVVATAQAAVRKLEVRVADGPVDQAMTKEAIEAARAERRMMAQVYFADNSVKAFEIDDDVTVDNLKEMVAVANNVVKIGTYGILDVSNIAEPATLGSNRKVMEVMESWTKPPSAANKSELMVQMEEKHKEAVGERKAQNKKIKKADQALKDAKQAAKDNKDKAMKKELKKAVNDAQAELKVLQKELKSKEEAVVSAMKHVRAVQNKKPKKGLMRALTAQKPKVGVHRLMFNKRLWTDIAELPTDMVELHLCYSQVKGYVTHGK
jgi:myosin heavy subunit